MMVRFAAISSAALFAIAACEGEHFPARLDRPATVAAVGPAEDASVDGAVADASISADADAEPVDATSLEDAGAEAGACNVRLDAPPLAPGTHVPEGTPITYASNPPSSGTHYPVWASFQELTHPVADGYLVHSLEHGAVLLLYKCPDDASTCEELVAALRAVRDAVPSDPMCDASARVRIVIAPRPANDTSIAASAWGYTYRSDCLDVPSLKAFITAHYAHSPEDTCSPGSSTL